MVSRTFQESVDNCGEFISLQPEGILDAKTATMLSYANVLDTSGASFSFLRPFGSKDERAGLAELNGKFKRVRVVSTGFIDVEAYERVAAPDPDEHPEIVKNVIALEISQFRETAAS